MGCAFRVRLNTLGSIWYMAICTAVQLYLLYLGLHRYRLYAEIKWPHDAYPHAWLTVYVTTLTVCIPLLVLFVAFGIFKSGNLAGDHDQIGARFERIVELTPPRRRRSNSSDAQNISKRGCVFRICHTLKSCWQHAPPFSATIHVALAFCQLFAQQVMMAQLYRYGFINSGDFLNTELDFAYHRARQLATNLPMGDTRLQGFRITSDELADSPMAPNLLPILMHARLFGIPLEFVNAIVALVAYSCTYPAVFWRVSKAFALCFSIHLLVHSAAVIYMYLAFSVLFRVQETNFYSTRPVGIGQYLWALRPLAIYHPLGVVATFVSTLALMHIATAVLYAYGHNKYVVDVWRARQIRAARAAAAAASGVPANRADSPNAKSEVTGGGMQTMCCDGYAPHVAAIVVLLLIVIVKAPTLYALTLLYQQEEKPIILSCIVVDVTYLFAWILLWLALTLKRNWNFRVMHTVREMLSVQDAMHIANGGQLADRSYNDFKNALLVMHRDHLFVTDDPVAKPSIMRHLLKICGGEGDTYWLRVNQSPVGRRIPLEDCHINNAERTPELVRLMDGEASSVPLAAAPYHYRMTLLPPAVGVGSTPTPTIRPLMGSSHNFDTLKQPTYGIVPFDSKTVGDYGSIYPPPHVHQLQQQRQQQVPFHNGNCRTDVAYDSYTLDRTVKVGGGRRGTQEIIGTSISSPPTAIVRNLGTVPSVPPNGCAYGEYGSGRTRDFDAGSTVSAQTVIGGVNERRDDYERWPTLHTVDQKNRLNTSYGAATSAKFVSFNENGVKTYSGVFSGANDASPSPPTTAGSMRRDNSATTNGSNATVSTHRAMSPSNGSNYFYGDGDSGRDASDSVTPTPETADANLTCKPERFPVKTVMVPPSIHGEPKITHNEESGSVFLECVVSGADSTKTKWYFNDTEIAETDTYKFRSSDEGGNRKKYINEIRKYSKALQGTYKAIFTSSDEKENFCTFTVQSGNAPEFYDKPKIVQKDGGNVISIKVRAKSPLEVSADWFKDDKPIKSNDRVKIISKPDDKEKEGTQFLLEITGPQKDDQAKYKCVVKNAEGQNQQSLNLVFD